MTSFSSDILLPFPNSNDLNSHVDTIEVLISKALINAYVSHDEYASVYVLREYNEMKWEIKNPQNAMEYIKYKQWQHFLSARKILRMKTLNKMD